jgi:hypothetical protein
MMEERYIVPEAAIVHSRLQRTLGKKKRKISK